MSKLYAMKKQTIHWKNAVTKIQKYKPATEWIIIKLVLWMIIKLVLWMILRKLVKQEPNNMARTKWNGLTTEKNQDSFTMEITSHM